MNLKEKLRSLPSCPGVYLMKDAAGNILYVGKSKNLKSRVGSYFQASKSHPPKVLKLVKHLKDFDYILTDTEFEAFMLECRLIKELSPQYNRVMNNQRSYCYVRLGAGERIPDIAIADEPEDSDGDIWFGPYTSRNTVERALQGIKETCRILCTGASQKPSSCLNYSLGLCLGTCSPDFPREQCLAIQDRVVKLLNGTDKSIITEMKQNMNRASEQLNFEKAAKYRDYIRAVNYMVGKSKVIDYTEKNRNIAVLERIGDESVKCFLIKGNKVLLSETLAVGNNEPGSLAPVLKAGISACFKAAGTGKPIRIGRAEIDESQIIYSYLNSKSGSCRHIVIAESWLKPSNSGKLDRAIDKLLSQL
ncbi:MAG TPA: UvrB/UvrC motif-containing protein [Clostridia bacterium]|nr:UvrB/UvrC motif-containing protein [Clostridia bacterium]